MQARTAQRPDILDRRRETVEHPFGTIKQWMNQGAFLMQGLEKVRGEFSLTALAYNLRRVLNIVELPQLIAALPAQKPHLNAATDQFRDVVERQGIGALDRSSQAEIPGSENSLSTSRRIDIAAGRAATGVSTRSVTFLHHRNRPSKRRVFEKHRQNR
jgi:hypothetical protein